MSRHTHTVVVTCEHDDDWDDAPARTTAPPATGMSPAAMVAVAGVVTIGTVALITALAAVAVIGGIGLIVALSIREYIRMDLEYRHGQQALPIREIKAIPTRRLEVTR